MKKFGFTICALSVILACTAAPEGRIFGGDDAVLGQIPYQAALSLAGMFTCGATILSENYAITAMECVCANGKPWPPQMFSITAGSTNLYIGGSRIVLEQIIVNPNYSELRTGIALLKLSQPFVFSKNIQAIELSSLKPPVGTVVEVSGWGHIREYDEGMYNYLQVNDGTVLDQNQCSRLLGETVNNQAICLGHERKNGICRGDFGGPAVYDGKLIGVAAYIVGECGSALPDVFINIAPNYNWIVEEMKQ